MAKKKTAAIATTVIGLILVLGALTWLMVKWSSGKTERTGPYILLGIGGAIFIVGLVLFFVLPSGEEKVEVKTKAQ